MAPVISDSSLVWKRCFVVGRRQLGSIALAAFLAAVLPEVPGIADEKLQFNRDIRPILSDNCFACHGPDAKHREADLRLDVREAAIDFGAIQVGKPEASGLIERIESSDDDVVMPPPSSHKKLTKRQKEILRRWIAEGAEYQAHWSYTPLVRPTPPAASPASDKAAKTEKLSASPIDAFIDDGLRRVGLAASEPADPFRQARRLHLDLLGLPPSNADLAEAVKLIRDGKYSYVVDSLLKSPHYGERMAVGWLDVVRYSDTVGYHGDQNQNIFPYRDYVIDAFNKNKPFDQFTVEQLAGDLLPNPTEEQRIATGFNRLNMMTREGGAQPTEYLAKYAADRVRTVGMAWMGATIGCAECHDHKFDPLTAKDFYALAAYFADLKQYGVYSSYASSPNEELKGFSNDSPFPPEIEIQSPTLKQRQSLFSVKLRSMIVEEGLGDPASAVEAVVAWQEKTTAFLKRYPSGWQSLELDELKSKEEKLAGSNAANRDGPVELIELETVRKAQKDKAAEKKRVDGLKSRTLHLKLEPGRLAGLRLELLPTESSGGRIVRSKADQLDVKLSLKLQAKDSQTASPLVVYRAEADEATPIYVSGTPRIGIEKGWRLKDDQLRRPQTGYYWISAPPMVEAGDELVVTIDGDQLSALRFSVSPIAGLDMEPVKAFELSSATGEAMKSEEGIFTSLFDLYFFSNVFDASRHRDIADTLRYYRECRNGKTWSLVSLSDKARVTRILPRGNWQDETGPVVEPSPPEFLLNQKLDVPKASRLDLAHWLVSRDNPLTARVFVNRLWKQFFGVGLCSTVDDVGTQGEPPSHPELLDWLAVEFIESGWDVKHIVRLILHSEAYRRSSVYRPELREADPQNRWLAAQNPRRLEAEFVRDSVLGASGLLFTDLIGGPSSKPFQPEGYYESLQFPDRDYVPDRFFLQYRRGLYTHWQRTFLHPMVANFDGPSREECIANRTSSNTPQQALTLLNDPSMVEAAGAMTASFFANAKRYPELTGVDGRIEFAVLQAWGRPPTNEEKLELRSFLDSQLKHYQSHVAEANKVVLRQTPERPVPYSAVEHAAWTAVCRVILNHHEVTTRY